MTVEELKDEMAARPATIELALRRLMLKGVIAYEPLTDKTYIRLLMPDIDLDAGNSKKARQPPQPVADDDADFSYR